VEPLRQPRVLIGREQIAGRIREMAAELAAEGYDRLVLLAVLKGSIHLASDLARELPGDVRIALMRCESYGATHESSGEVRFTLEPTLPIAGEDVLIVEDIIDSGLTLIKVQEKIGAMKPRRLRTLALLRKPEAAKHRVPADLVGFEIEPIYVVGYGLDSGERYRHLPYVGALDEAGAPPPDSL
jgi:hypoxanthine phosphoribosyltransferase